MLSICMFAMWPLALNSTNHRFIYDWNHCTKNESIACTVTNSKIPESRWTLHRVWEFFWLLQRNLLRKQDIICIMYQNDRWFSFMKAQQTSWHTDNILATLCGNWDTIAATEIFTVCFYGTLSLSYLKKLEELFCISKNGC